jgi:hypothetical protein
MRVIIVDIKLEEIVTIVWKLVTIVWSWLKQRLEKSTSRKIKELEEKMESGEFKFFKKLDSYKPEIFIERSHQ